MALSPDGHVLASPSGDMTVKVSDLESRRLLLSLEHPSSVFCVAWSPDGTTLASGCDEVFLWDATTGRQIRKLEGHSGRVKNVAWSPDGKMLASCSSDQTIRLWDTEKGRALRELKGHTGQVDGVDWSPDGRRLCSGSWDDTVRLWHAETGEALQTLAGHKGDVGSVAWSPNGRHVASGSDDLTVRIWSAETGQQRYVLEGHTADVVSVSFLDDGRLLASLDKMGGVILWWTETWDVVARWEFKGDNYRLCNLALHARSPVLAAASENMSHIDIWGLEFALVRGMHSSTPTVHYVNAKAVLLGDSGVGKSGLGIRIAEG